MEKLIDKAITDESLERELKANKVKAGLIQSALVKKLAQKGLKAATAESCTGGLISKKITETPGASAVFECGVCSYGNNIKEKILGVKRETLEKYGAVSACCAMEMARGVSEISGADIGVSTTGIAGPGGGTAEKPVGLVYMGLYYNGKTKVIKAHLNKCGKNSREKIREYASVAALYEVLKCIG